MATKVGDAYIEVHGDLSRFRKDLNKAAKAGREAGAESAESFWDGWNRRSEKEWTDQWQGLLDAMYSGKKVDWEKALGRLDSDDLDAARNKMYDLVEEAENFNKVTDEGEKEDQERYGKLIDAIDAAVDSVKKQRKIEGQLAADRKMWERAHLTMMANKAAFEDDFNRDYAAAVRENMRFDKNAAAERVRLAKEAAQAEVDRLAKVKAAMETYKRSWVGMIKASKEARIEKDIQKIVDAWERADWSGMTKGAKDLDVLGARVRNTIKTMEDMGRVSTETAEQIRKSISHHLNDEENRRLAIIKTKEEAERYKKSLVGLSDAHKDATTVKEWKALAAAIGSMDFSKIAKGHKNWKSLEDQIRKTAAAAEQMGIATKADLDTISVHTQRAKNNMRQFNVELSNGFKLANPLKGIFEKMSTSWARMDDTVRTVLTLIATGAGPMATLGSGLAGSVTAIASSIGMAAAALIPLATGVVGLGAAAGLAVTSWDEVVKHLPRINTSLKDIGATWTEQASIFGREWRETIDELLHEFSTGFAKYDFGEPFGIAAAEITNAFRGIVTGGPFAAFMEQMETNIPTATAGLGVGFAGVFSTLISLLAGAAPVAAELGTMFGEWGTKLAEATEKARETGVLQTVFEKARDSLVAVLDLAGSIGNALGTLFMLGADSGNRMLGVLTGLVDKFNAWMQSEAGRATMLEWFQNAETIMGALGPVIGSVATALAGLVTPESITQFSDLMTGVSEFIPILGELLGAISALGIFNTLAALLNTVGAALEPLLPPLKTLLTALGEGMRGAITALSPLFASIGAALAPVIQHFAEIAQRVGPKVVELFGKVSEALSPVIDVVGQVAGALLGFIGPILGDLLIGIIEAAIDVIDGLIGIFKGLGDIVAGVVQIFQGDFAGGMATVWDGVVQVFTGAVTALWGIVRLWVVGKLIGGLKAAFSGLGGWLGGIAKNLWTGFINGIKSGWAVITAAIATAIGGFIDFVKGLFGIASPSTVFMEIGTFLIEGLIQGIQNMIGFLVEVFTTIGTAILDAVTAFVTNVVSFFSTAWNGLVTIVTTVWTAIQTAIQTAITFIQTIITTIFTAISAYIGLAIAGWQLIITTVWNAIKTVVSNAVTGVQTVVTNVFNAVSTFIQMIWTGIKVYFGVAMALIRMVITTAWNNIKTNITNTINNIKAVITTVWNAVKSFLSTTLNNIKTGVTTAWNNIKTNVTNTVNAVKTFLTNTWNNIKTAVTNAVNGAKSNITTAWNNVKSTTNSVIGAVKTFLSNTWNGIKTTITNAVNGAKSNITTAFNNAKSSVTNIVNGIVDFVRGIPGKFLSAISGVSQLAGKLGGYVQQARTAVSNKFSEVVSYVSGIPGRILSALGNLGSTLYTAGTQVISGFMNGIGSMAGSLISKATGVVSGAINAAKNLLNLGSPSKLFHQFGVWTGEGLVGGLDAMARPVADAAEKMAAATTEAFASSKMRVAGQDAGRGLADGLLASKSAIAGAYKTLTTGSISATIGTTGQIAMKPDVHTSAPVVPPGKSITIESGAIQLSTQSKNPETSAHILLDELASYARIG
jgi:phage-related protein